MQLRFAVCVLLLGSLSAAACGSNVTTAPTTTRPTAVTETFLGTLSKNGAVTYPFATGAGGVTATVTALAPDSTLVVGVSMGIWNGITCQVVLSNDNATQGSIVIGNATAAGNLCIRIHDIGSVVQSATYQIDVSHS